MTNTEDVSPSVSKAGTLHQSWQFNMWFKLSSVLKKWIFCKTVWRIMTSRYWMWDNLHEMDVDIGSLVYLAHILGHCLSATLLHGMWPSKWGSCTPICHRDGYTCGHGVTPSSVSVGIPLKCCIFLYYVYAKDRLYKKCYHKLLTKVASCACSRQFSNAVSSAVTW
jgi:hypothetical protein